MGIIIDRPPGGNHLRAIGAVHGLVARIRLSLSRRTGARFALSGSVDLGVASGAMERRLVVDIRMAVHAYLKAIQVAAHRAQLVT